MNKWPTYHDTMEYVKAEDFLHSCFLKVFIVNEEERSRGFACRFTDTSLKFMIHGRTDARKAPSGWQVSLC